MQFGDLLFAPANDYVLLNRGGGGVKVLKVKRPYLMRVTRDSN